MRTYNLFLPVFKQGDDFSNCIESNNGHPVQSFLDLSEKYKLAAEICQTIATNLALSSNLDDIEVNGSTHSIWISMPEEIASPLVRDGILVEDVFDNENE